MGYLQNRKASFRSESESSSETNYDFIIGPFAFKLEALIVQMNISIYWCNAEVPTLYRNNEKVREELSQMVGTTLTSVLRTWQQRTNAMSAPNNEQTKKELYHSLEVAFSELRRSSPTYAHFIEQATHILNSAPHIIHDPVPYHFDWESTYKYIADSTLSDFVRNTVSNETVAKCQALKINEKYPLGSILRSTSMGLRDTIVVGYTNLSSDRNDYPPSLIVYDLFGESLGSKDYFKGLRLIPIKHLERNEVYVSETVWPDVRAQYYTFYNQAQSKIREKTLPFPSGTLHARVFERAYRYNSRVHSAYEAVNVESNSPYLRDLMAEYLRTEFRDSLLRLDFLKSEDKHGHPQFESFNKLYSAVMLMYMTLPQNGDVTVVEAMGSMDKIYNNLTRIKKLNPNTWTHHSSNQVYQILGFLTGLYNQPMVVYFNVQNFRVYSRPISDWNRSMSYNTIENPTK